MAFTDLPDDWPQRSITDHDLIDDILDLVVRDQDRDLGALIALVCTARGRLVQPICVTDLPTRVTAATTLEIVDVLISGFASYPAPDGLGLLLAVARAEGHSVTCSDRMWDDAARHACAAAGWIHLGSYGVTFDGAFKIEPRGCGRGKQLASCPSGRIR